jgi:hypothetical protein
MTNRVDLYQAETGKPAAPAGGAFVFIEGQLCLYLEVTEIVQADKPDYGITRLRYNPAADSDEKRLSIEEVESEVSTGKPVVIKWLYNNLYPSGGAEGIVIFTGQVERIETILENV